MQTDHPPADCPFPSPTYQQVAESYPLWQEYADPGSEMTEAEFLGVSIPERLAFLDSCFGDEANDYDADLPAVRFPVGERTTVPVIGGRPTGLCGVKLVWVEDTMLRGWGTLDSLAGRWTTPAIDSDRADAPCVVIPLPDGIVRSGSLLLPKDELYNS